MDSQHLYCQEEYEFACSSGQCIAALFKCDGERDCDDGSDDNAEVCGADCENVSGGGFACADGQCIKAKECNEYSNEYKERMNYSKTSFTSNE